jgi:hypothetical protein
MTLDYYAVDQLLTIINGKVIWHLGAKFELLDGPELWWADFILMSWKDLPTLPILFRRLIDLQSLRYSYNSVTEFIKFFQFTQ